MSDTQEDVRFIRKKVVAHMTGYTTTHIMTLGNNPDNDFPAPIKMGTNRLGAVMFIESEVLDWIDAQVKRARRPNGSAE